MKCLFIFTPNTDLEEGLNSHLPLEMYPLLDKPFVAHTLEQVCTDYDIDSFHFLNDHYPEAIQEYFADGVRWGQDIKHYSMSNHHKPTSVLKELIKDEKEILIIKASHLSHDQKKLNKNSLLSFNKETYWARLDVQILSQYLDQSESLTELSTAILEDPKLTNLESNKFYSCASPQALLDSQELFFKEDKKCLRFTATEIEKNVFISSNVIIHPTVKIESPAYIGHNCQINKAVQLKAGAVINNNVIIDEGTTIENSLILDNNYIGQGLEINKSIVDRLYIYNCHYKTTLPIVDNCFVANLHHDKTPTLLVRFLAFITLIQFIPIILLLIIYRKLRAQKVIYRKSYISPHKNSQDGSEIAKFSSFQKDPFSTAQSYTRHFLCSFIPGLYSVLRGQMNIFGMTPRTYEQLQNQRTREMYLQSPIGLLSEDYINQLIDKDNIRKIPVQRRRSKIKLLIRYISYVLSFTKIHRRESPTLAKSQKVSESQ